MANKEMKTWTLGDVTYEIVDEKARQEIDIVGEKADEALSLAKGATRAFVYDTYADMISELNVLDKAELLVNYHVMIRTVCVPDLWVSDISDEYIEYTYTSNEDFITDLTEDGVVQVGYFVLSALETQKVDLNDYVSKSDFNYLENVYVAEYKVTPFADILAAFQQGKLCYLYGCSNAMYILTHCYKNYAMFTRVIHGSEKYEDRMSLGTLQGVEVYPDETWKTVSTFIKPTFQTLIDENTKGLLKEVNTKTTNGQIYTKSADGTQTMLDYSREVLKDGIVQRYNGQVKVPNEPANMYSATSKHYVDTEIGKLRIPTQKVIRTTQAGTLRCEPNITYMIYCTDDEDATLRGYGSKNKSDNDSGGYVNISAKVLSVTCGGVGDTYADDKGNTIIKKWGDTEAEYFATAVQTSSIVPVSSIKPRRGVVYDSEDGSQYAEISYPADCTIMINVTV